MESVKPDAAYIIQMALTPVFLLAGTAGLLNVFTVRLARVSDRVNNLFDVLSLDDDPTRQSWRNSYICAAEHWRLKLPFFWPRSPGSLPAWRRSASSVAPFARNIAS